MIAAGDDHDPVPAVAGHEVCGEAGAREAAECRDAEGKTVLPGREVVLAKQEDGQSRTSGPGYSSRSRHGAPASTRNGIDAAYQQFHARATSLAIPRSEQLVVAFRYLPRQPGYHKRKRDV